MGQKYGACCRSCPAREKNIFREMPTNLLDSLEIAKSPHVYHKRQVIHFQGHPSFGIYCIRSGRVKVYRTTSEGKQYIERLEGPGAILGLSSIFTESPYLSTVEAIEETEACFISRQVILDAMTNDRETSLHLTRHLARLLEASEEERTDLAYSSVKKRMARELILLAETYGVTTAKGVLIQLRLSREELAELIGTAPETAMRLLKIFREQHLLEVHGRNIVLLDQERLRETSQTLHGLT